MEEQQLRVEWDKKTGELNEIEYTYKKSIEW